MPTPQKKTWLYKDITSVEQANLILKRVANVYIVLGVFLLIFAVTVMFKAELLAKIAVIVTGAVYAGLGFALKKYKTPAVAIAMMVPPALVILVPLYNFLTKPGTSQSGAGVVILPIALLYATYQALRATRYLKG